MATTDRRGVTVDATDTPIAGGPNPGLAIKSPCLVATAASITLAGLQTIDGVALIDGSRVLVWQQTDETTNGVYNASTGPWTRAIDVNSNDQIAAGMQVAVSGGDTYAGLIFLLASPDPITLGSSDLTFEVAGGLPATRRIDTTAPLTGGGDLTSDRTLSISGNGITYALFQQIAASRLFGNPTGVLATGQAVALGATLLFSGTALQTAAMSGDVASSANSFVTTIQPNVVSNAKLRQSAAMSLIGNASNATANVADIAAASDNQVMRRSGTAIAFGAISLASSAAVTGTLPAANGGTGATSLGSELTVSGNVLHVANNGITYALFQQVAASSLVGNATGGAATATGITLGATLAFSGSALQTAAHTGDVTTPANSFVTTVAKIAGTTVSGTTGTTNAVFSASPTFTGSPVLAAPSATTLSVGATSLAGYIFRVVGGNANQMSIDNTGQQYTEFDYCNNGSIKVTTYWDNLGTAFHFRTLTSSDSIIFDTATAPRLTIGGDGNITSAGGWSSAPPTTKTANYSHTLADSSLIFNGAGTLTLTLLSAATYPGRELLVKTIAAQAVVSASSNVVPLAGGAAGTAILAATAGKWALLKSNGSNWEIMAAA